MTQHKILPPDFALHTWEDIQPFYDEIIGRRISNVEDLKTLIKDIDSLDGFLEEDYAWRYIRQSCNTLDDWVKESYKEFVEKVQPGWQKNNDEVNRMIVWSQFVDQLGRPYDILIRGMKRAIELYREENISLFQEEDRLAQQYNEVTSKMTIEYGGKEITVVEAGKLLKEKNRDLRKSVWEQIITRRSQDYEHINNILDKLIEVRNNIARNCWFESFVEYKHYAKNRFDYTSKDVLQMHQSIKDIIVPLCKCIHEQRCTILGHELKPYDYSVSLVDKTKEECYTDTEDLISKLSTSMNQTHPWFGEFMQTLYKLNQLDLDVRKGKGPGGYNYPLALHDTSFIFMNITNNTHGLFAMLHEGWHALHHYHTYGIIPSSLRHPSSEVCETASMAQELLSMDKIENFFSNKKDYQIALAEKLGDDILTFPRISQIDLFQRWIYDNPGHTHEERSQYWIELNKQYGEWMFDCRFPEYTQDLGCTWQKTPHIFDYAFYYIEYAMASLAAIALRKQYLENPQQWVQNYINILKVGNTERMPDIFAAGGIKFDFSAEYIRELLSFIRIKFEGYNKQLGIV